ncbi:hypothetical protein [Candidatus Williamhamiltonella defendens]
MNKWLHCKKFAYKKPVGVSPKFDAEKEQ